MLEGKEFGEVKSVIARVFNPGEFDMFLFEKLNFRRSDFVDRGPFLEVVSNVLDVFVKQNREAQLIAEVAAARPLRSDVQDVYKKYAVTFLSDAQREQVQEDQLAILEKYGLSPGVDFQRAGRSQFPSVVAATHEGFQRKVRGLVEAFDPRLWIAQCLRAEQRVCSIEVQNRVAGSGFLVAEDLVLTNYHVLKDAITGKLPGSAVQCRFDYRLQSGAGGATLSTGMMVPLVGTFGEWHVDSSEPRSNSEEEAGEPPPTADQLDHALVRLDRPIGSDPTTAKGPLRGWIEVPAAPLTLEPEAPLMILHYPEGAPVKLSVDTSAVQRVNPSGTRVRYTTNTDPGSSGSPCFSLNWSLVALHHFGDTKQKPARFNQGVPIKAIRDRLDRVGKAKLLGGPAPV